MSEYFVPKIPVAQTWQIAVVVLNLLLLGLLRVNFGKRLNLILNAFFSNRFVDQLAREDRFSSNVSNILLDAIYVINLALFLFIGIKEFTDSFSSLGPGVLFVLLGLLVLAFIIAKWLSMFVFGWLFDFEEPVKYLLFQRFLNHSIGGLILIPVTVFVIFASKGVREIWLFTAGLFVLMFVFRMFRLAFQFGVFKSLSAKYIILYICGLEILPLLLLVKISANYL